MEKKEQKDKNNSKHLLVYCLLLMLLVGVVVGVSFAAFVFVGEGSAKNTLRTGELTFTFTEDSNGISLTDALPVSDVVGKKTNKYFDFSVSCRKASTDRIQYEVYATEVGVDQRLEPNFVKIYLTDVVTGRALPGYEGTVPSYSDLKDSNLASNAKRLYVGTFDTSGTQSFRLRMWLSDKYQISASSKKFKIKVNVSANS